MTTEPTELADQGKSAFQGRRFEEAADLFEQSAKGFALKQDGLMDAEMRNNRSVALLQAGKAQQALDAVGSTDQYFAQAGDIKREAMALGNQAAALDALHRFEEAIQKYEYSAELFGRVNEGDLRAMVLKSAAAIKLKTGNLTASAFKMISSVEAKEKPSLFERFLKFITRLIK